MVRASLAFGHRSLVLGLAALAASGCPNDSASGTAEDTGSTTTAEPSTSGPSTSIDPDTSTSIDPDTSTSVDPDSSSSSDASSSSSSGGFDGCGDGNIDEGEKCDGDNLDGRDCMSENFVGGVLACQADCTLDTSGCTFMCGDGNVQGDEQCEGDDHGGETCVTQGFDGGNLGCNVDCTFDTSGCENYVCGDGTIAGPEVCDADALAGETCASQGFDGGVLACAADCASLDASGCYVCGDGVVDVGEACDGVDLGGETCVSQGLDGGVLACAGDCTLDLSACVGCGNGDQDPGEDCDGGDFGGVTCTDLGFDSGALGCTPACTIAIEGCFGLHQFCAQPNAPIGPDAGTVTLQQIVVTGLAGNVVDVDVAVLATHSFLADLDITVRHVDTDLEVALAQNQCIAADIDATFDQDAASPPDCVDPVGIEGDVLPVGDLDTYVDVAGSGNGTWELNLTDESDGDGGTLLEWCVAITNEAGIPTCSNGADLLAVNPGGDEVVCDDPTDGTCEQDAESLCPTGWGLCTAEQHNNRNTGFDYPVSGIGPIVIGEIYCRGGGAGAGHITLGPYDGITNLDQDAAVNCGYGSSRDACPTMFGCNELSTQALCCAPNPLCGNGVVDAPEEACDDGDADETNDCLNSCGWRVPTAHGQFGTGC